MFEMLMPLLAVGGGIGLLFGGVYPLCGLLLYPLYKAQGGRKRLIQYLREL